MGRDRQGASDLPQLHQRASHLRADGWFQFDLLTFARALVRLAEENAKPNNQRLPEYTDARRASLELALYSPAPIHNDFEELKLADSLGFMVELLGADHPLVKQVLAGKTPEARADEMITGTKLGDVAVRKELAAGGKAAIDASTDPMIVVARTIDAKAREVRKRYESELTGVERANYAKIAARFSRLKEPNFIPMRRSHCDSRTAQSKATWRTAKGSGVHDARRSVRSL